MKNDIIQIQDTAVTITQNNGNDYICITDMAKAKEGDSRAADVIKNWIRTRTTLEFIGTWEMMNNPNFKVVEFDHFKTQAGLTSFVLSVSEWIDKTNAIGMYVKSGRYGGTYAHKDIAFEFGSAISAVFKLYLIKEYQRLKDVENDVFKIEWNAHRVLSKINYLIHTDAVQNFIVPQTDIQKSLEWIIYAEEADLLNVALFGCTAKQWRDANPAIAKNNNIRDFATLNQLAVLSNLETHNAELIKQGIDKKERYNQLLTIANYQLGVLSKADVLKAITNRK
jgi:hypothetical protein